MPQDRSSLDLELADIRAEIARLQQREAALAAMAQRVPQVPVLRRGWPMQRAQGSGTLTEA